LEVVSDLDSKRSTILGDNVFSQTVARGVGIVLVKGVIKARGVFPSF
jgi:hypothetical protein